MRLTLSGTGQVQLTDKAIRALKPKDNAYKASDGQGLYLLVTRKGSRLWRFDYRFQGKRQTLSLDTCKPLWSIPAAKMKMRQPHVIPLSRQSLALLEELRLLTGQGTWCFPSIRTRARPMSETTMNAALRRLGYAKEEVCPHGFRSTASTLLNESGLFNPDAIEAQLAHRPRGGRVRATYMRGEFFEDRVAMMAWWSEYLDGLAVGKDKGSRHPASVNDAKEV